MAEEMFKEAGEILEVSKNLDPSVRCHTPSCYLRGFKVGLVKLL
jgi:hypothetical protein